MLKKTKSTLLDALSFVRFMYAAWLCQINLCPIYKHPCLMAKFTYDTVATFLNLRNKTDNTY